MNDDKKYLELIKRFPLRPITSDEQNLLAAEICDGLAGRDLTPSESDYLEVLSLLISEYESRWTDDNDFTPRELIQYLMKQNNLAQKDLVREFGTPSRASEYLRGERNLSVEQARRLAERFSLNVSSLLKTENSIKKDLSHKNVLDKTTAPLREQTSKKRKWAK